MRRSSMPKTDDDVDESFISQFETTLSIRPTTDAAEDEDISIDHTTVLYNTTDKTIETNQNNQVKDHTGSTNDTKFKFLSKDAINFLRTTNYTENELLRLDSLLAPSTSIDLGLVRYNKTLQDFFDANPQIVQESPKFKKEASKTLVLLSPFSTEHAFGRSWVSKSYLNTIFERPQRMLASCIGVAAASTMYPFFYKVKNSVKKGSLFSEHVKRVHGSQWPENLLKLCLESHDRLCKEEIEVPDDWNAGDIYLTPRTITAVEGVLGTIETAVDALFKGLPDESNHNLVFASIRPPGHHAHSSLPSGFCVLNNAQISSEYASLKYGVTHCAILDIDLHHGDGTQDICWERAGFAADFGKEEGHAPSDDTKKPASYPKIGYFSLHDVKSYPTELGFAAKENIKNASLCIMDHDLNIWNVHLQEWTSEEEFYKYYQTKYVAILNRANQFFNQAKKKYEADQATYVSDMAKFQKYSQKPHMYKHSILEPTPPKPFKPLIIISAGFDASEYENPQMQRHGVNVPTSFYARFTKDVVRLAQIHTEGKVLSLTEGGYSDEALSSGIFSHLIGFTNNHGEKDSDDVLLWNETWGNEQVIKELCKGCKKTYSPYKNPRSQVTIWANEVIKLGRSMMPNAILPASYVYHASENGLSDQRTPSFNGVTYRDPLLRQILDNGQLDKEIFKQLEADLTGKPRTRYLRSQNQK